jgi:uncharacterized protein
MSDFRPTSQHERLELLDALRGFSLCGILLANLVSFAGFYVLSPAQMNPVPAVDRVVLLLIDWLIEGKFYALFSMLFGIGFALQAERARQAGIAFVPLWRRRMLLLTGIGLTHLLLVWHGDILTLYSLLGLLLPFFIAVPVRRLRRWIVALLLLPLAIHLFVAWTHDNSFWTSLSNIAASLKTKLDYEDRTLFQMRTSTSALEVFSANILSAIPRPLSYLQTGRIPQVLGQFLLGVWLAQMTLPGIQRNERLPRRAWMVCGSLGLLSSFGYAWIKGDTGSAFAVNGTGLLQGVVYHAGSTLLALGYAGAFAALWANDCARGLLRPLVGLGRMALSNYLTQSAIGVLLFYGYGLKLMGKIPFALIPLFGALILSAQWLVCRWWLQRFSQGPLEFIWRKATYRASPG